MGVGNPIKVTIPQLKLPVLTRGKSKRRKTIKSTPVSSNNLTLSAYGGRVIGRAPHHCPGLHSSHLRVGTAKHSHLRCSLHFK